MKTRSPLLILTTLIALHAGFSCMADAEIKSIAVVDLGTKKPVSIRKNTCKLAVGGRYRIDVAIHVDSHASVYVEPNPAYPVPKGVFIHNQHSDTEELGKTAKDHVFTFFMVPAVSSGFTLAFQIISVNGSSQSVAHKHTGITIQAVSEAQGIYGIVRSVKSNRPVTGVEITLSGGMSTTASGRGEFHFREPPEQILSLTVSKPGYSSYEAVNIPFSGDGMRIDCQLEESLSSLCAEKIAYKKYDDRSQGSTLMHVVAVPRRGVESLIAIAKNSRKNAFPYFETALEIGERNNALVVINGGYFELPSKLSDGKASGFLYANGSESFTPFSYKGRFPVLGINSTAGEQHFQMVEKTSSMKSPDWAEKDGRPVWDDTPRDGISDITYAIQCDPILLRPNGTIPGQFAPDHYKHWARTAVGVGQSGNLILLVADGEGLHGCQGASMPQMAAFFNDVLNARAAMNLDGGGSTQLAVRTPKGMRLINTLTAEHPRWLPNGRVHNFLLVQKQAQ